MKSASRRCSNCRKKVATEDALISHLKAFCGYQCLKEYTDKNRDKIADHVRKQKRKDDKQKKEKLKTRSQWMKEAQAAFNAYVRWRDRDDGCISCARHVDNNVVGGNYDCGHFRSVGSAPHLRFHLWNANKQCVKCNRWLSGAVNDYRVGLIWKLGHDKVDWLEQENSERRFDIEYLKRIKRVFAKKLRQSQKKC